MKKKECSISLARIIPELSRYCKFIQWSIIQRMVSCHTIVNISTARLHSIKNQTAWYDSIVRHGQPVRWTRYHFLNSHVIKFRKILSTLSSFDIIANAYELFKINNIVYRALDVPAFMFNRTSYWQYTGV